MGIVLRIIVWILNKTTFVEGMLWWKAYTTMSTFWSIILYVWEQITDPLLITYLKKYG